MKKEGDVSTPIPTATPSMETERVGRTEREREERAVMKKIRDHLEKERKKVRKRNNR